MLRLDIRKFLRLPLLTFTKLFLEVRRSLLEGVEAILHECLEKWHHAFSLAVGTWVFFHRPMTHRATRRSTTSSLNVICLFPLVRSVTEGGSSVTQGLFSAWSSSRHDGQPYQGIVQSMSCWWTLIQLFIEVYSMFNEGLRQGVQCFFC